MSDQWMQAVIGVAALVVALLVYWIALFVRRRRIGTRLRQARPWQLPTLQGWVERRWLDPELAGALPEQISPAGLFYEWAWADPEVAQHWRLRQPVLDETPVEAIARDAWSNLPPEVQEKSRQRLAEAVRTAGTWWGGAERGWNRRPLAVLATSVTKRQAGLPLLALDDLTSAPLPGVLAAEAAASSADGADLLLVLAVLYRASPRFRHPLAPKGSAGGSMIQGLSKKVVTDVGSRIGAGLGAALGPIGSMVGQYLGGLAGSLGGEALMQQSLPAEISQALKETERALATLGQMVESDDFARAARQPEDAILELGKRVEIAREDRARRLRERIWPTESQALVEEVLKVALSELKAHRAASEFFITTARKAPPAVAGGMILQNPWLVRSLPGSVERLNSARTTLNQAALALRRTS